VVVQDTHWSETASFADVALPSPTYLEKTDIVFSDHHLNEYQTPSGKIEFCASTALDIDVSRLPFQEELEPMANL